jgi:hypothetical protein
MVVNLSLVVISIISTIYLLAQYIVNFKGCLIIQIFKILKMGCPSHFKNGYP